LIKVNFSPEQESAALRDFDLAYVGSGSKREFPHFGPMSASSASSGHWVANASAALCQELP
jgi:hypothetical protein